MTESEIRALGGITPCNCLQWFETVRTAFFREKGHPYDELEKSGLHLPVVESSVFIGPGRLPPENLTVSLDKFYRRGLRFFFVYTLKRPGICDKVGEGMTVHVPVDDDGRFVRKSSGLDFLMNNKENAV